jgi:2,4-dienoyl-CoA reductase-like NADH-dependent reductase (Old Yellow Enzyme family)
MSDWICDILCVWCCAGIGWHEARIPTIATMVPRGAFTWVTARMKGEVSIPLCTTNRINTPEVRWLVKHWCSVGREGMSVKNVHVYEFH